MREVWLVWQPAREPAREILRRRPADMWHAEGVDDTAERTAPRGLDAVVDVRRALFSEAVQVEQLLLREEEHVRRIRHETALLQLRHERPAHALDVHPSA